MKNIHHQSLQFGYTYHIYNRGANKCNVFLENKNYYYFMEKYFKHIEPIAKTFAYCLMKNHFHCIVQIRPYDDVIRLNSNKTSKLNDEKLRVFPSQQFSNFFNSYTKTLNKAYGRTGTLWEGRFKRKIVEDDNYLKRLIAYIHLNPEFHQFVDDFRKYKYSSYWKILSNSQSFLPKQKIINLFDGRNQFVRFHEEYSRNKVLHLRGF